MLKTILKSVRNNNNNYLQCCTQVRLYVMEENQQREFLAKYSEEDGAKILKIINNYNLKDLLSYDISKGRANKLLAWRMRNGLLSNLNDIFFVEGFGTKVADKFYQSLLQDPKPNDVELGKPNRAKTAPFITPLIDAEHREKISSCVSVRIGVNSISWAKLELPPFESNQPCQLTHWHHHELSEKKLHLNELIQRCLYVDHLIPSADCYLFESPQMAQVSNNPGSVEQQNINIQKAQVTAVMGYALAARNSELEISGIEEKQAEGSEWNSQRRSLIFYVRRFLTARLFNHLVGTERVSSEDTILNMMRIYYNLDEMEEDRTIEEAAATTVEQQQNRETPPLSFRGKVQFPLELREMFSKSPRYHREFMGQALLLNLTFVRLVLLQDADSIAKVSRGNKTKNGANEGS